MLVQQLLLMTFMSFSMCLPLDKGTCTNLNVDERTFITAVTHGIHSLYLEPLRYFFEPNTPEDNGIHVIDPNLNAESPVLKNSPFVGYDSSIPSFSLRSMDFIFRHDSKDFLVNQATTVEKLGHEFHMQDLWTKTQKYYIQLKSSPQKASEICPCIESLEPQMDGALKEISRILRHFGLPENERDLERRAASPNSGVYVYFRYNDALTKQRKENNQGARMSNELLESDIQPANDKLFQYEYETTAKPSQDLNKDNLDRRAGSGVYVYFGYGNTASTGNPSAKRELESDIQPANDKQFQYEYETTAKPSQDLNKDNLDRRAGSGVYVYFGYGNTASTGNPSAKRELESDIQPSNDKQFQYEYESTAKPKTNSRLKPLSKIDDPSKKDQEFQYEYGTTQKANLRKFSIKSNHLASTNWIPGTVNNDNGWPQMMEALKRSDLPEDQIKMIAQFLFCKLNT